MTFSKLISTLLSHFNWLRKRISGLFGAESKYALTRDLLKADLKRALIQLDLGNEKTASIIQTIEAKLLNSQQTSAQAWLEALEMELSQQLQKAAPKEAPELGFEANDVKPNVILLVGVNGSGKTTSLAKIAAWYQARHHKVLFASGDTFRSGALEQLQFWGAQLKIDVVGYASAQNPAAVMYDALQAAQARKCSLLLADSAGRLQQPELAEELKKMVRTFKKLDPEAPHHVWMVVDAHLGQSNLKQFEWFQKTLKLTGLVLTKLDGSAQGGTLLALMDHFQLPVKFIGVGEGVNDLELFDPQRLARRWTQFIQDQAMQS